jgi:hypothetical protein
MQIIKLKRRNYIMSNEVKRDELLEAAVENITEEELQAIAAAGDVKPEATPAIVTAVTAAGTLATKVFSCGKGFGC